MSPRQERPHLPTRTNVASTTTGVKTVHLVELNVMAGNTHGPILTVDDIASETVILVFCPSSRSKLQGQYSDKCPRHQTWADERTTMYLTRHAFVVSVSLSAAIGDCTPTETPRSTAY